MNKSSEDISPSKDGISPLGVSRYGRTRKPKISEDFCDIDDAIERTNESYTPTKTIKQTFKSPINQSEYAKTINALQNVSEKTTMYDVKIKPVTHVNTAKIIGPKPRKFFKTAANVQPHITGDYVPPNFLEDDLGLTESIFDSSPVDVSQVLKIITAKNTPEVPVETKKSPKQLKTYVNKRKKVTQQPVVIESFGLPDEPIIPLLDCDAPFEAIKELDVGKVEPEKVNLIDSKLIDTFWQVDPTVEVAANSIDEEAINGNISDETPAKDKENLGNRRMTRSKSQYCDFNKSGMSDEEKIETPKRQKKSSKSPAKSIPKSGKQKTNLKESKDTPKQKKMRQETSCSNGIESYDDKFININKLKDQLSVKIENGRPVGGVEIVKVKKSPRTPKQGYDETITEEDDLKLIQYSKDELRKIIGEIDPFEDKPILPKVDVKASPALDRKETTSKKTHKSDDKIGSFKDSSKPTTPKSDIETSLRADTNETTPNKRFKSHDNVKISSFDEKSKPKSPTLDSTVVDTKTTPKESIKLDSNDKSVETVVSAVLTASMSPVVVLHRTQETERRTRGSMLAKSLPKVEVPREENVNEIAEETKKVKPKTVENSTNEVLDKVTNDEEVVSVNTTPKIPVIPKETERRTRGSMLAKCLPKVEVPLEKDVNKIAEETKGVKPKTAENSTNEVLDNVTNDGEVVSVNTTPKIPVIPKETERRTRGSMLAKSSPKVEVPLAEYVNEIAEETKAVKPKTIENSTNEVLDKVTNDEEVISVNTTPKVPVVPKETERRTRGSMLAKCLPKVEVPLEEDVNKIVEETNEVEPKTVENSTNEDKVTNDVEVVSVNTTPKIPVIPKETKRRTRGSMLAKSLSKVEVPLEEDVNKIAEETNEVEPKTVENSTNEVLDKVTNDEEVVSVNTTPKAPVIPKEDLKDMSKDIEATEPRKNAASADKDNLTMDEGMDPMEEVMPAISLQEISVTSKEDLKEMSKEIEETKSRKIATSPSKDKLKKDEIIPSEILAEIPVTSKEALVEMSKETAETKQRKVSASTSKGEHFELGDLMWAKIGNFPYWPCLITLEPISQQFTKVIFKLHKMYHVRFFGDNGRRSWVKEKGLLPFLTVEKLENLQRKNRNEVMVPTPNSRHHKNWLVGIEEAKSVQDKTYTEKLEHFEEQYEKKKKKKRKQRAERDSSKRKRKPEDRDGTNHTFDSSDPEYTLQSTQKKKKQKNTENYSQPRQSLSRKNKDKAPKKDVASDRELDDTIEILNLMDSENRITRSSIPKASDAEKVSPKKKKHLLDESDSDSVISMQDSPPFTMEDQITLYKRNNLFKGVSRERVCQVCLKPGVVLKCKGRCCSYYHVECAKKGYTDDDNYSKIIEEVSNSSEDNASVAGEKVEITNISNKEVVMTTNTHKVEIVHIKDRKRLTPTDLTLDNNPDFNKLPLFDKIDQKMKEVMEPVVEKPLYADSTTDYSSADDSLSPVKGLRRENGIVSVNRQINGDVSKKLDEEVESVIGYTSGVIEDKKLKDVVDFKCKNCLDDFDPLCFVCDKKNSKTNSDIRQRCSLTMCGRFYHPECLKIWPQTQWSVSTTTKHNLDTFVCPAHVCHTCVSDDPRMAISRCSSDKVVKCLRCPATYHTSNSCVPAGTEILTSTQIVCPRHGGLKSSRRRGGNSTINTTWCFICSKGGALICCETCPTSVHAECLDINYTDDDKFICEDCETGRFPLYDEIVWVKLGNYRWWPALILFPNDVPENVRNLGHNDGEFVVKFFGTHDHYWISKGRVFVFEEGDTGGGGGGHSARRKVETIFKKSIQEATVAHQLKKEFKESVIRQSEEKSKNKPPPYIKIKANRPVGNVRQFDGNISNTTPCECDPKEDNPCGADSDCLNRLLMTECDPDVCPAGEKCENQCFEKRYYPHLVPYKTEGRGWGLKSLEPITKGQFVIEYVGEMIDEQEYQRRIKKMHEQKEENYYFLTIDKDRMIDAGPKGNVARFMNHCCQPNCETQKWTVNGDTRVGLFAVTDIPPNTELTFNYMLECVGKEKKICRCGAPNCSGFIGVKAKQVQDDKKIKHRMKYKKRKRSTTPQIQETKEPCFVCGETGDVNGCNNKICTKFYHSKCVNLDEWSEKWICPWHNCNICSKRTIRCCTKCVNSYCPPHSDGHIRHDRLLGFICSEHDPSKADSNGTPISTKTTENRPILQTEETDITSTTSDEGSVELELPTIKPAHRTTEPSDIITSTPIKNNTPNENGEKRKRGRPRKSSIANLQKRIKIDDEVSNNLMNSIDLIKPKTNEEIPTSIPNNVEVDTENLTEKDRSSVEEESTRIQLVDEDSSTNNSTKTKNIDIPTSTPKIVEIQIENLTTKERRSAEKESPRTELIDDESTISNTIKSTDIKIPSSTPNTVEVQKEKRTKKERRSVEQESPKLKLVDNDSNSSDTNPDKPKNDKTSTPKKLEIQMDNTKKDRKCFEQESPRLKLVDDDSTPTNSIKSKSKTKSPSKIEIRKENVAKTERKSIEKQSPRKCSLRSSRRLNNSEIIVVSVKEDDVGGAMTLRKRRGST